MTQEEPVSFCVKATDLRTGIRHTLRFLKESISLYPVIHEGYIYSIDKNQIGDGFSPPKYPPMSYRWGVVFAFLSLKVAPSINRGEHKIRDIFRSWPVLIPTIYELSMNFNLNS